MFPSHDPAFDENGNRKAPHPNKGGKRKKKDKPKTEKELIEEEELEKAREIQKVLLQKWHI